MLDELVGLGVPDVLIDAVEDAREDGRAAAEHVVEALAEERHLQLDRVGRAHGGEQVGVAERALHEVDRALVAAQLVGGGGDVAHAEDVVEQLVAELALELDVMHREHALHVVAGIALAVELAQEHGHEGGLPVVAHADVALQLREELDGLADGLGEEREALAIVEVAVDGIALEVGLVVEEVEVDAVVLEMLDAAVHAAPCQGHVHLAQMLHLLLVLPGDGAVLGHDDRALGALGVERLGQRARDVAQAAGLGEGHGLGGREQDLELSSRCHGVPSVSRVPCPWPGHPRRYP